MPTLTLPEVPEVDQAGTVGITLTLPAAPALQQETTTHPHTASDFDEPSSNAAPSEIDQLEVDGRLASKASAAPAESRATSKVVSNAATDAAGSDRPPSAQQSKSKLGSGRTRRDLHPQTPAYQLEWTALQPNTFDNWLKLLPLEVRWGFEPHSADLLYDALGARALQVERSSKMDATLPVEAVFGPAEAYAPKELRARFQRLFDKHVHDNVLNLAPPLDDILGQLREACFRRYASRVDEVMGKRLVNDPAPQLMVSSAPWRDCVASNAAHATCNYGKTRRAAGPQVFVSEYWRRACYSECSPSRWTGLHRPLSLDG
jgi:hypothetical protein